MNKRIILAVTGASGMPYAALLAEHLGQRPDVDLHLIVSRAASRVLALETDLTPADLGAKATAVHAEEDIAAPPASGSWRHHGMIVCPCSMGSLAAIAQGLGNNLIHRAADVALKERLPLVLAVRETPLSLIHIENMARATRAGAIVLPACPGFYHRPASIHDLAAQLAGKILDAVNLAHDLAPRWGED